MIFIICDDFRDFLFFVTDLDHSKMLVGGVTETVTEVTEVTEVVTEVTEVVTEVTPHSLK